MYQQMSAWFSVFKFCLPCVTLTCTVNVSLNVDGSPSFCHSAISVIALTIFGMFMSKTAEMHVLQFVKFRGQKVVEFDLLLSVLSPGIFLGILPQHCQFNFFCCNGQPSFTSVTYQQVKLPFYMFYSL